MPSTQLLVVAVTMALALLVCSVPPPHLSTYRAMIYAQNEIRIKQYNERFGQYYTSAPNKFTHLTNEEMVSTYLGELEEEPGRVQKPTNEQKKNLNSESSISMKAAAGSPLLYNTLSPTVFKVDYTQKGSMYTTSVKDQGGCGSCWIFAAVGEIESYFLKYHKLHLDLAEQQIVDCVNRPGHITCGGGTRRTALQYVAQNPIALEKYYPYTAVKVPCNTAKIAAGPTFKTHGIVSIYDCHTLTNVLLNNKPIAIGANIDDQWFGYSSGVIPTQLEAKGRHAILLVGAASDGTNNVLTNYWKIKNSWGPGFGENGFLRFYRDPRDPLQGPFGICDGAVYSV